LLEAFEESAGWALVSYFLRCFKLAHICIEVTGLHTGEEFESINKFLKFALN